MTKKIGITIGKFFPMHLGHEGMIEFGAEMLDELIVIVSSPNALVVKNASNDSLLVKNAVRLSDVHDRARVIKDKYAHNPKITIHYMTDNIGEPAAYDQHGTAIDEEFWDKWIRVFKKVAPHATHFVSSDRYGKEAAHRLGIEWLPFDPDRELINISATQIRANPLKHWKYISKEFKHWYGRVVVVTGAESSGKSTLAKDVAQDWNAPYVPEYGRIITEAVGDKDWTKQHFIDIVRGQAKMVRYAIQNSENGIVISDTDIWVTALYAAEYLGINKWDFYSDYRDMGFQGTNIIAVAPTLPWVDDGSRIMPDQDAREEFYSRSKLIYAEENMLELVETDRQKRVKLVRDYICKFILPTNEKPHQINLRTEKCKNQVLHTLPT